VLPQQLEQDEQPVETQQLHTTAAHRSRLQYEVPLDSTEAWLKASKLQGLEKDKALTTALKDCSAGEGRVQVNSYLLLVSTNNYYALPYIEKHSVHSLSYQEVLQPLHLNSCCCSKCQLAVSLQATLTCYMES
jgi:hypothetical protein